MIKLPDAWALQTDCSSVRIGVIDSGILPDHEDLRDNLEPARQNEDGLSHPGVNFTDPTKPMQDIDGHGTHV
ncbi:MAG: hypothetical protein HRT45_15545 [Bdellovibrionales bacterium]|nr:hypothetical protein [Bdellovibrionales bacterium]